MRYRDRVEGRRMRCYSYAMLVRLKAGKALDNLPPFNATPDDLRNIKTFDECQPGEFVLYRWRRPTSEWVRKSLWSHVGLKYDEKRVVHLSGKSPDGLARIQPHEELLATSIEINRFTAAEAVLRDSHYFLMEAKSNHTIIS